jgi:hypothetical protein
MADTYMTATVTLKGKTETYNNNGDMDYKLELDCPAMRSNFPLMLYVPAEVGGNFDSTPKTLVLRTNGKVKESYKGDTPWHWKWRFVSLADEGAALTPFIPGIVIPPTITPTESPHEPSAVPSPVYIDPTRDSIERQVAAKAATTKSDATMEDWDKWFYHVIARIQNTPAPNDLESAEESEERFTEEGEEISWR